MIIAFNKTCYWWDEEKTLAFDRIDAGIGGVKQCGWKEGETHAKTISVWIITQQTSDS
jgi:hypothetical protein